MRTATIYNFLMEANIMASIAILLMLLVRRFLRGRLGNRALYFAWLLVAVRLLCPLALPNPAINQIRPAFEQDQAIRPIAGQLKVRFSDAASDLQRYAERNDGDALDSPVVKTLDKLVDSTFNGRLSYWGMVVYLSGAALTLLYFVLSNLRFRTGSRPGASSASPVSWSSSIWRFARQGALRPCPCTLPTRCPARVLWA